MIIKFCKRCIMPSTKPDLKFAEDGICQGCKAYENRKKVDWSKRKHDIFIAIIYFNKPSEL